MSKLRIVNARTPEQWAEIIQSKWQDSVKGIMDVGLALHNAREELGKPEFWKMVRERLRYADSSVRQLIQIGTNAKLMSVDVSTLPAGWGALYALARLTDEQFQRGLDNGAIHAGMAQKDIKLLKPPKDNPPPNTEPALTGRELIEQRTFETRRQIVATLRELNHAEQIEFISLLRFQLDDLQTAREEAA